MGTAGDPRTVSRNPGRDADPGDLDQITYFLESGSNRIGGLDFQSSPDTYVPRGTTATLDELHAAADALQEGRPLSDELMAALVRGTSIGGARPKVLMDVDGVPFIAKFSSTSDHYPVVNSEALAFEFARRVGIDAPRSFVTSSLGKDVLMVERFDREPGGKRRLVVSGLTMLGLDEMMARYATYPDLLDVLRRAGSGPSRRPEAVRAHRVQRGRRQQRRSRPKPRRVLGRPEPRSDPRLRPVPQTRSGETSAQAMAFGRDGQRDSSFAACLESCPVYGADQEPGPRHHRQPDRCHRTRLLRGRRPGPPDRGATKLPVAAPGTQPVRQLRLPAQDDHRTGLEALCPLEGGPPHYRAKEHESKPTETSVDSEIGASEGSMTRRERGYPVPSTGSSSATGITRPARSAYLLTRGALASMTSRHMVSRSSPTSSRGRTRNVRSRTCTVASRA